MLKILINIVEKGLIMFLDFVLGVYYRKNFNFSHFIVNWVKIIQIGSFSNVVLNGHSSEQILLSRGCRDLLFYFILFAEFMILILSLFLPFCG